MNILHPAEANCSLVKIWDDKELKAVLQAFVRRIKTSENG